MRRNESYSAESEIALFVRRSKRDGGISSWVDFTTL